MTEPRAYDLIVSAGGWCAPAVNIRRYFTKERAYPFDWWISPYESTIKILNEDFRNMLDPENLSLSDDRETVKCSYYGSAHPHDFSKGKDGKITPLFLSEIGRAQEKLKTLVKRLDEDSAGKDVLFIRSSLADILPNGQKFPTDHVELLSRAAELWNALRQRYPLISKMDLLAFADVPDREIAAEGGTIIVRPLGPKIDQEFFWDGNYVKAFTDLGIVLRKPAS